MPQTIIKPTIAVEIEIPDDLHTSLTQFIETHPIWDMERLYTTALSLFLLQQGEVERTVSRIYLESLLHPEGEVHATKI